MPKQITRLYTESKFPTYYLINIKTQLNKITSQKISINLRKKEDLFFSQFWHVCTMYINK